MRGSKCPIDSSSSNDREAARGPRRGNHLLSDICRYLEVAPDRKSSRENVELGLEIEINESLKRVLTAPNSGSDDLLDVTIIRPSESDVTHETTVALNKDEVRDFITLVEQHHQNKLRAGGAKTKKSNKRREDDVVVPDHIPAAKQHVAKRRDEDDVEEDNAKGPSGRGQGAEKPGTPCVCQHCGIMGVLVQSHKAQVGELPQADDEKRPHKEEKEERKRRREKSADRQKESRESKDSRDSKSQRVVETASARSVDQVELLREINTRIKNLEKRIAIQEETAVPRDYLKHVLHKVLTQYKVQNEQQQQKPQNVKNTGTQYVVELKDKSSSQQKKENRGKHYQVHTLLHTPTALTASPRLDIGEPSSASAGQEAVNAELIENPKKKKESLYFWGEEVVTPGCDLKTKILNLLEEKIGRADNPQMDPLRPLQQSKIPIALPEKLPKSDHQQGIRVERDDKLLFLGKMDEIKPCNIDDYVHRSKAPEITTIITKPLLDRNVSQPQPNAVSNAVPESLRLDSTGKDRGPAAMKGTKNNLRNVLNPPKQRYPFDPKRTLDDSTFRKNIEAHKEKLKEKPKVEEKFFDERPSPSATTESKASMECMLQKLKNNRVLESMTLARNRNRPFDNNANYYASKLTGTLFKENMTYRGFRKRKPEEDILTVPVDITYINPRITQWSEESTASEDKYMKYIRPTDRKQTLPVETKESLIYKLEFLKNLAKHKSADQSKVLNKIWTQAKRTAKSKNDAVFIKIPFKSVNTVEPRNNVIEMQLTLEQLETVVKSVKVNGSTSKIPNYKSSSEIDFGQRRHEEIKRANMEVLNRRRHLSAKTNRNKK